MREILADTTSLRLLADLNAEIHTRYPRRGFDCLSLLSNVFTEIHVPLKAIEEFERYVAGRPVDQRAVHQRAADRIRRGDLFHPCSTFDTLTLEMLTSKLGKIRGIDDGEAEAVAQAKQTGRKILLTDDLRCAAALKRYFSDLRCISTLYVVAVLDLQGTFFGGGEIIGAFLAWYPCPAKFSRRALLRHAYIDAARDSSFQLTRKELDERTGTERLGNIP